MKKSNKKDYSILCDFMKNQNRCFVKSDARGVKIQSASVYKSKDKKSSFERFVDPKTGLFRMDYFLKTAWFRKGLMPRDLSKWKLLDTVGESSIYVDSNEIKYVVKPCNNSNPRIVKKRLVKLAQAKLRFETPLGILKDKGGRLLLITRFVGGESVAKFIDAQHNQEKKESVVGQAAKILAKLHKAGFLHNHAHKDNFVIYNGQVRMIDATLVTTKRSETLFSFGIPSLKEKKWGLETREELRRVTNEFSEFRKTFINAYRKEMLI